MEAFYKAFHKAETAYGDYQDSLKNWEQRYTDMPQSLHDRLRTLEQKVREQPAEKHCNKKTDRGAR